MNIITGYAGTAHVTAEQTGANNACVHGTGKAVFNIGSKLGYSIISNNEIDISDGYGINQGRYFCNESTEAVTISTGTADTKRTDLIVARYAKDASTLVETITLEVIEGEAGSSYVDPEYVSGDILSGDTEDEFPLYRVNINGISIESVEAMFDVVEPMQDTLDTVTALSNNLSDEYNSSTTYSANDYCIYNNTLYKCILTCSGIEPTNTTYWEECKVGTELTSLNDNLANKVGAWKYIAIGQTITSDFSYTLLDDMKDADIELFVGVPTLNYTKQWQPISRGNVAAFNYCETSNTGYAIALYRSETSITYNYGWVNGWSEGVTSLLAIRYR